ncbi:hypothetical protein PI125_g9838 [Phytophthora idaei]|nr:hypothetical protein PI125_g9838 [Phytophthora idaei]
MKFDYDRTAAKWKTPVAASEAVAALDENPPSSVSELSGHYLLGNLERRTGFGI